MRASDSDRERIADRLRAAAAEGRLLTEELEERLSHAFSATTYGDLDALTADLPREQVAQRRSRRSGLRGMGSVPALALLLVLPIAFVLVLAMIAIVFAMLTAWTVLAAILWVMIGHRRGWHGPRWAYGHRRLGPRRPHQFYPPRRANSRSGIRL